MATIKKPRYKNVDGVITINECFSTECVREALEYTPRPDDLFIVTYPKCGTTWTQTIVLYIFRKGVPMKNAQEFFSSCPFFELAGLEAVETMHRPGAIKTHFPFHLHPYSPDAKYIYVARNPKDCCVSFYHHTRTFPSYDFEDGDFNDFFELFFRGETDYGDYFAHTLSWYEHRDDSNVLFLTYEDMKRDTRGVVLRIAEFIGDEYRATLEQDPSVMENILFYSSFAYMKEHFKDAMNLMDGHLTEDVVKDLPLPKGIKYLMNATHQLKLSDTPKGVQFIRKGVVGDWRNHFTREQSDRLDKRFQESLGHTELADLWKEEMKF